VVQTPKAVAERTDIIVTMLPNSPHVKDVVLGQDGIIEAARPGMIVIDMSSIAPLVSREIAERLAEKEMVPPLSFRAVIREKYHDNSRNFRCDSDLALSALLTTTMPAMADAVKAVKVAGLPVKTIIGGAPVTQEYADRIGADGFGADAPAAVRLIRELLAA
jgi:hypothetical protein